MRVLGLDPGLAEIGYGILDVKEGNIYYFSSGRIVTDKNKVFADRLFEISEDLYSLIDETWPDTVVVEKIFFYKNISTCIEVAHARGCLLAQVSKTRCKLKEYVPGEIKKAVTGNGVANKKLIKQAVNNRFQLKITNDNEADGIAIALTYAMKQV